VCRARRPQGNVEQLQELEPVAFGDQVGPVEQAFGHEGEQLDERHAGVGRAAVRPFRGMDGDPRQRVLDELLVASVVDRG
jgi:hypothetical protein